LFFYTFVADLSLSYNMTFPPQRFVVTRRIAQFVERLEDRRVLAGAWHNADLPCDVDASELVTSVDALSVINELNRSGARSLTSTIPSEADKYFDVSGDDTLSAIDALLIINALNRTGPVPTLAVSVAASDDPNFNGIVLGEQIHLSGQTIPHARIRLHQLDENGQTAQQVWQGKSDSNGVFQHVVSVAPGLNAFTIEVRDELGRKVSVNKSWFRGDVVVDWNATMLNAIRDWTGISNDPYPGRIVPSQPPVAAKNLAMLHLAMFDAANAVEGRFSPYLADLPRDGDASQIAALATAAHRVVSQLYSDRDELPVWDATLAASLAQVPDGEAKTRGIQVGETVAARLLAARANDGARSPSRYTTSSLPGHWNRTAPDFTPPLLPQWPGVTPFAIGDIAAIRPTEPPALDSPEYAIAVDEVMRLGKLDSQERSSEQTEIAKFWADGAGTATPPGHWNRIATNVIMTDGRNLLDHARTLALLNLALADAGIASWDAKYQYDLWRPIDAIRRAAEDGNDATIPDASWSPFLKTPAFPSYVSGHSTFSAAAATVLTHLYGDNLSFTSSTDPQSGLTQRPLAPELITTRKFSNFWQAAEEAGVSRIYGGIHYAFDNISGLQLGRVVGDAVHSNWLQEITPGH
jgi:membrane-associated phospholipid phosphatase